MVDCVEKKVSTSLDFVMRINKSSDVLYSNNKHNEHYYTVVSGKLLSSAPLQESDKRWLELMMDLEPGTLSECSEESVDEEKNSSASFEPKPQWETMADVMCRDESESPTAKVKSNETAKSPKVTFDPVETILPEKGFPMSPQGVMDASGEGMTPASFVELGLEEIQI